MADHSTSSRRNAFALAFWTVILAAFGVGFWFIVTPALSRFGFSGTDARSEFRLFAILMLALGYGVLRLMMSIDEKLGRINNQLGQMLDPKAGRFARIIEPLSAMNEHMRSIRHWSDHP